MCLVFLVSLHGYAQCVVMLLSERRMAIQYAWYKPFAARIICRRVERSI